MKGNKMILANFLATLKDGVDERDFEEFLNLNDQNNKDTLLNSLKKYFEIQNIYDWKEINYGCF